MANHGVQAVGNLSMLFTHPDYALIGIPAGGVILTGMKLDSNFLNSDQLIDNSKLIALLNGDTMSLTNGNKSGSITFNATRASGTIAGGDVVKISQKIVTIGDSIGGTLVVTYTMNNIVVTTTFLKTTVKRVPPMKLAGNDLPDYAVQWNYADYDTSGDL